jgi:hypothetical protein
VASLGVELCAHAGEVSHPADSIMVKIGRQARTKRILVIRRRISMMDRVLMIPVLLFFRIQTEIVRLILCGYRYSSRGDCCSSPNY